MSEIEKMYKLAGVNKKCIDKRHEKCTGVCYDCKYFIYLPFTAEKQISLIIFLSYEYGRGLLINLRAMDKDIDIYDFELFGECLAKLVNELWKDLTKDEKQQVKGILC